MCIYRSNVYRWDMVDLYLQMRVPGCTLAGLQMLHIIDTFLFLFSPPLSTSISLSPLLSLCHTFHAWGVAACLADQE